ncbi:NUDIX hydrolase [Streptomyces sp. NPDC056491]|uniref:NUDIX hydrolase n=1 Tax=Streptomyces sp. NPDC056491 TaxID=3345837 RepID=UPI003681AEDA
MSAETAPRSLLRAAPQQRVEDGHGRPRRHPPARLWALPGGGHDAGESIAQTVVREVEEGTGIAVVVEDIVGLYTDPQHVMAYDHGEVRQQLSICFHARPIGGSLRTSSESKEVRWVAPADLDKLDIHPSMRLRIKHGLDSARSAPYIG